jgi:hypothetical protein
MTKLIQRGQEGLRPLSSDLYNKIVVLNHTLLNSRHQIPRFQLLKATGGFGCKADSLGKIFARCLADGSDVTVYRRDLIGEANEMLVHVAMSDVTPVTPINEKLREFLVIAKGGQQARGETVEQAKERLKRITRAQIIAAYEVHPESYVTDMGFLTYPEGIRPVEIKVRKGG